MENKKRLRMCISCRQMKEKEQLIRVVRTPEGEVIQDDTYKANGRGAYICKSGDCLDKCKKTRSLERALKCRIPEESFLSFR